MKKIPIAILGATGMVGQKLVELLIDHPLLEIDVLAASDQSADKRYIDCIDWKSSKKLPLKIQNKIVSKCSPFFKTPLVFSALSSDVAYEIEKSFLEKGYHIISNAKNFRLNSDVPLIIPEVNASHIEMIELQKYPGKIITNPNCAVAGLALGLSPLFNHFGIEKLHVCTMQAISGAGLHQLPEHLEKNIIPHIPQEEEKIETEPTKIFGQLSYGYVKPASFLISAQCNRVPTLNGHFMNVSVKLSQKASLDEIKKAWIDFKSPISQLPSAPLNPIQYFEKNDMPQPKINHSLGMHIGIGKLQTCFCLDFKFNLLVDNLIRGAAGAALLNAELFIERYPHLLSLSKTEICATLS